MSRRSRTGSARLLRRRGDRRGHRRHRPARDRDHRGRGGRRRRVRRRGRGAARRQPHRLRRADASSSTTPRRTTRRSTRRSTSCVSASATSRTPTDPLIDGNYAEMDISGTVDGEPVDAMTATRLPLRGRLGRARPRARRGAARQEPGRHRRVHRRRCPSASATSPAKRSRSGSLVKDAKRKVLPELTDEWVVGGHRVRHASTRCARTAASASR